MRKLLVISTTSIEDMKKKGNVSHIEERSLNGYFGRVYSVSMYSRVSRMTKYNDEQIIMDYGGKSKYTNKISLNPFFWLKLIFNLSLLVRQENVCAIKANSPLIEGLTGCFVSKISKKPLVIAIYSNYDFVLKSRGSLIGGDKMDKEKSKLRKIISILLLNTVSRIVFSNADMVFAISKDNAKFAIKYGSDREKTFILKMSVSNIIHHKEIKERTDLRQKCGWLGKQIILFVGRLSIEKFPMDAIKCFEVVNKKLDDVILVIVGDGIMKESLINYVNEKGLNVQFLGSRRQEELVDLYHTADVILLPLSGLVLIEAALSSTPLIAYDIEWHKEFIKNGETGYLVKFRDYEDMAKKTLYLLTHQDVGIQMGKNARNLALEKHGLNVAIENERRFFQILLGRAENVANDR